MTPGARPSPHSSPGTESARGRETGHEATQGQAQKADNRPEVPAATPGLAVELRDVRRQYGCGAGTVHARTGIDLALPRGTFTAVMGPSGSGKSTFLQRAAGLDRPTAGSVASAARRSPA